MPFLGEAKYVDCEDGVNVDLLEPLFYRLAGCYAGGWWFMEFAIPAGYRTDFATVPWILRLIYPRRGPWNRSAILHDYLCEQTNIDRFLADAIFRIAMAEERRIPLWRRVSMYYGVRVWWVIRKMLGAV